MPPSRKQPPAERRHRIVDVPAVPDARLYRPSSFNRPPLAMFRLLHTADWHLGHTLHDFDRSAEHQAFLDWLRRQIAERDIDALLIAGDIFDSANPPASAQAMFYDFLAGLARLPHPPVVLVAGGNHDSAARLDAPAPVLKALNVHVVGAVDGRRLDEDALARLLVPLPDRHGGIAGWCALLPFVRPADLPPVEADAAADPLVEAMRALHQPVWEALARRAAPGQLRLASGHAYLVGGVLSELSERKVLGGNQHALPVDLYPAWLDYVALGHLHRAQAVGGRDTVRYSGSPLPLALDEAGYPHQVMLVEFEPAGTGPRLTPLPVPRHADIVRLGQPQALALEQLDTALAALAGDPALPPSRWPYLSVRVALERPEPQLRKRIEDALDGRPFRLARIDTVHAGSGAALADSVAMTAGLEQLAPQDVFGRLHASRFDAPPAPTLQQAFEQLLAAVREGESA